MTNKPCNLYIKTQCVGMTKPKADNRGGKFMRLLPITDKRIRELCENDKLKSSLNFKRSMFLSEGKLIDHAIERLHQEYK